MTNASDLPDLSEDEQAFLRRCTERPAAVDTDELVGLLESPDGDDRHLGARGLLAIVRERPALLADEGPRLVDFLDHEDDDVRKAAISGIRHLVAGEYDAFDEPPIEPLVDRLGREDQPTSRRIAQILIDLLDAEDPRLTETVDRTVDLFEGDQFAAGSAIQALVELGRAFPEPVLDRIGTRLTDEHPAIRKYAVRTLAALAEDLPEHVVDATADLVALVEGSSDEYTREHALSTLQVVATVAPEDLSPSVPLLTDLVDADHDKVRRHAVSILATLGRADLDLSGAVDALSGRLEDTDKIARRDACYTLGLLRAESALPALRELREAGDLELQAVAALAVERITEGESEPPLSSLEPGEVFVAWNQREQ